MYVFNYISTTYLYWFSSDLKEKHTVPNNRSISKDVYDSKLAILCMVFIREIKYIGQSLVI